MRPKTSGLGSGSFHVVVIIGCVALLSPSYRVALAQGTEPQNATPTGSAAPAEEAPKIPNDQLDSLVAPIALYSDSLLAQTLAASTYPLSLNPMSARRRDGVRAGDSAPSAKSRGTPHSLRLAA